MDDVTKAEVWSGWMTEAQLWANENLFAFDTLFELGLIAFAASLAWPLSIALRKKIKL